jgi:beta-lactamase class C
LRHYAYGYSKDGRPVRVSPGVPNGPAYGVRTTATELIRFVEANLNSSKLEEPLRRAIAATQTGYYRVGPMVQGLGWEMYPYPVDLDGLLSGNSADILLKPQKVTRLDPPMPQANVLVNKTGSTNGFGAYIAFVPEKGLGIVMLANRNYPIPARVKAAHQILTALDTQPGLASAP